MDEPVGQLDADVPASEAVAPKDGGGRGKKSGGSRQATSRRVLASSIEEGASLVGAVAHARTALARVVAAAPAA